MVAGPIRSTRSNSRFRTTFDDLYRHILALFGAGFFISPCSTLSEEESEPNGRIVVQVLDASGGIIPNARVLILQTPATVKNDQMSFDDAELQFDVPPGTYDLRATAQGFIPQTRRIDARGGAFQRTLITIGVSSSNGVALPKKMGAGLVDFPEQSQAASLDGRYAILAVDRDSGPQHTILFEDRILKTRRLMLVYERHVVLLWHLDSKIFALTEYVRDDNSQCRIYSEDDTGTRSPFWSASSSNSPDPSKKA